MIIIADSGSTSTEWRLIDEQNQIQQFRTKGINPYHDSPPAIAKIIAAGLPDKSPKEINFYGAGCTNEKVKEIVNSAFQMVYGECKVIIESDTLAAARSLCGREEGLVCIIGTGSSSCYYDGVHIKSKVPSLGYILGDEGSGGWLGRRLISDFFGRNMDSKVRKLFEEFGDYSQDYILERVYKNEKPAEFLASYSQLISENINEPYFYKIVYEGFQLFVRNIILGYEGCKNLPIHFSGSVAFVYGDILRKVLAESDLYVKNIVQSPIAGLTLFHQESIN